MSSYQQYIFALIAKLGGSKDKAVVDPTLCRFMGGLQGGVFLAQLLYWSDKGRNGEFYKTYKEWEEEIFLSKYEVSKAAKQCVEMGFLETSVRKANGNPTVHYRILQEKFIDVILAFVESEMESQNFDEPKSKSGKTESESFDEPKSKSSPSLTETTTETTAKTTQKEKRASPRPDKRKKYKPDEYSDIILG